MAPTPSQRLYEMGDRLRAAEAKPVELPKHLVQPESRKPIRPLGREVSEPELQDWLQQISNANPWFALTYRNIDLVTKTFLFDERLSPQHTMADLIQAVKIADAEQRLDKNAPPPKPKFEDSIEPWKLPMPTPAWELRKATKEQLADYIERAKRYEVWLKENQSE